MNHKFSIHQAAFYLFSNNRERLSTEPYASYLFKYIELFPSMPKDATHTTLEYLDKYKISVDTYKNLLAKAKEENDLNGQIRMETKLANELIQINQYEEAIVVIDENISNIKSIAQTSALPYALNLKYKALKNLGKFELANTTLESYLQLNDSLTGLEVKKFVDSLNVCLLYTSPSPRDS